MLSEDIVYFFKHLSFTIVTTQDNQGYPHNACKGIVKITPEGKVYLLDLFKKNTYKNLEANNFISVTGIDENKFEGYCLKGKARIEDADKLEHDVVEAWEKKINSRITQRVINSVQGKKGHISHPEALLPKPKYLIVMDVDEVIDLTPAHIKIK
ncbi:MAG: hypothetical protein COV72_04790 [Candidatus Omnitrophica bacterium CG11_big_fil_rev_8_21_14_0_20_42_13]|uniref:Pyridoxamine 5'-phosphate oxidase N-terminal domain-containing protein n=1 Tax=Candidatus Ghiorseimicrobium undicola TaxID=1974746 RepID=A0A2H0M056_9BACT|nr:MAG: hypothetical protein COV72_04790 [Candidatus Omnitrophica bacterium CG11_big_fil_rev_8_21_14_0_20_42_13]